VRQPLYDELRFFYALCAPPCGNVMQPGPGVADARTRNQQARTESVRNAPRPRGALMRLRAMAPQIALIQAALGRGTATGRPRLHNLGVAVKLVPRHTYPVAREGFRLSPQRPQCVHGRQSNDSMRAAA